LVDVFDALGKEPGGTFHGFGGITAAMRERRIDWILVSPELRVQQAFVDRASQPGGYASDHFPVVARLVR
jgi:endonuclease/exonuclease/phosphatase family metal-dependent hydrolase